MNVPQEVIDDLLPLYVAGEVSPATKAFVEQYLARNPALAEKVRNEWPKDLSGGGSFAVPPAELELVSLRKTRSLLALQRWIFGAAIAFTGTAFAVEVPMKDGKPTGAHFMLQEYPAQFTALLAAAIICWVLYYRVRRRLKTTL